MAHAAAAAALAVLVSLCAVHVRAAGAASTLQQGQSLGANDTLVSPSGTFTLRFFTPAGDGADPSRVYLGVVYARAREQTVPWVANRDAAVSASSAYSAAVTPAGELQVMEGDRVAWRTNTSSPLGGVSLALEDNGNLVLTAAGGGGGAGAQQVVIWQSFDHPTDTFLPGMSIALERRDGAPVGRTLFTSWRGPGDPATGGFTLGQDPLGSAQLYIWRRADGENATYWRSGQWANTNFVGVPWRSLYVYGFKLNGDPSQSTGTISYTFNTYNSSLYRFMLHPNGTETCFMLLDATGEWETVWSQPTVACHAYNMCGANAACADDGHGGPVCACLEGFQPRSSAEYGSGNWTGGCVRSEPLACEAANNVSSGGSGGDGFAELREVKLPNYAAWSTTVGDADACRRSCLANCSCGAYSYSSGTSCLTWGQQLEDIYRFPNGDGYDLYIKVPASILDTGSKTRRWTTVVVVVVVVLTVVLAACGLLLWKCRRRIKEKLGIGGGGKASRLPSLLPLRESRPDFSSGPKQIDQQEEAEGGKKYELPLFSLEALAAATGDFSIANKLGEGGFGHVYKGRLPGGEEIAVKRLSRSSGQGLEEFKNEVILIAKLQHRNLVKLLGCCIQGEEKMLVYEYMPNKSLDAFLFDPERRGLLDWRTRFSIIEGVARGLLYLHRDSRLRVVHRDLKASNILLDAGMNPKISDFGMARIFGGDEQQQQANTDRVVGTLGYMSPEYAMEGLFSVRSDVYSFGVLVLEIVSGKKNSSFHHMEGSLNIVGYAWQLWAAGKAAQLVDPAVLAVAGREGAQAAPPAEALRCVHLALLCVQDHACDRPDIPYVVMALGSTAAALPTPRPPTFTLQCTSADRDGLFRGKGTDESYSACDLTVTMLQEGR